MDARNISKRKVARQLRIALSSVLKSVSMQVSLSRARYGVADLAGVVSDVLGWR